MKRKAKETKNTDVNKSIKKELTLDKHQQEAVKAIETTFEDYDRCLVKMFCGKKSFFHK
jgi:superfamily II DNA or RNA helicase